MAAIHIAPLALATRQGEDIRAARCSDFFPLTPALSLWGERGPFSPRWTIHTRWLSTARSSLFPLPEGEGQGEGKRRELPLGYETIPGTVELGGSSGKAG